MTLRVGRIPYVNCYPVYGAIDRGVVRLDATLVNGVPTELNRLMSEGALDVSVVSAVEYARDSRRYLLLPDLAISCDGPVRSVMLSPRGLTLSWERAGEVSATHDERALLELLFEPSGRLAPSLYAGMRNTRQCGRRDEPQRMRRAARHRRRGADIAEAAARMAMRAIPLYMTSARSGRRDRVPFVFAVWARSAQRQWRNR